MKYRIVSNGFKYRIEYEHTTIFRRKKWKLLCNKDFDFPYEFDRQEAAEDYVLKELECKKSYDIIVKEYA